MRPAYLPIVGSGPNACVLHYTANGRQMREGELLLVDAGCEYDCYASDVTRTYPVNGRFSPEQRAIYEIVLNAHAAALKATVAGNHWNEPHDAAVRAVVRGLRRVGLLTGSAGAIARCGAHRQFFMHRTGHWLGMDVHDVGDYKVGDQWRVLEPGMVMTVEPGIYIPRGAQGVHRRWQGIGVRIEDDVLVTRDGIDVLTRALPREPDEVEALVGASA
jgi:Xaa-Pro aminopeptidase